MIGLHANDVTFLVQRSQNIYWAGSTSEPMKDRLFIDHIMNRAIILRGMGDNCFTSFLKRGLQ